MRNALVDIGSNTIRLVVYDGKTEVLNFADYAGLIADVKDGVISENGILKIVKALTIMKNKALELECDSIYAFATASLRDIKDKQGLVNVINEACGIEIEIISGMKEAQYDYEGLKSVNNLSEGIAFDLGGGSCQLILMKNCGVESVVSLPIGSLRLHTEFVKGSLPETDETEKISDRVKNMLLEHPEFQNCGFDKIYAMGGAVFALCKLIKKYGSFGGSLTLDELGIISSLTEDKISAVVPDRLKTVIPAAVTMAEILKYSKCSEIIPTPAGVRDGILYNKFCI